MMRGKTVARPITDGGVCDKVGFNPAYDRCIDSAETTHWIAAAATTAQNQMYLQCRQRSRRDAVFLLIA